MPTEQHVFQLTVSLLLVILICFIECIQSQTDVSSFGIFASTDTSSTSTSVIKLLLSWNKEQWECVINDTISQSTQYYMCTSGDFEPNATLINNTLSSNTYQMKIELIEHNMDDVIHIETIRVFDDDSNYYDINSFCLPPEYRQTAAGGTSLERIECCYWSQRYLYSEYAMGNKQNAALQITYAQFRSNVLDFPNQALEGAIQPPMITEVGITTLDIEGAESLSTTYSLTLHWDTKEYSWTIQPNQSNKSYIKTFSDSTRFCELSSGFSLEMTTSSNDPLGIDTIIVKDESGYYYNIDRFCPSKQIVQCQGYNESGKQCGADWSDYTMYYGFIYNATAPIYFVWDKTIFLNADKKQHGMVLDDDSFSQYSCSTNDVVTINSLLFKDDMDDPISTGWIFSGTYRDSINAVNCPGGSNDRCSRLAGHQASTTINSSMEITVDISNTVNMIHIVQYDLSLSTMPSGKSCYLSYAFDDNSFLIGKTHTSSGSALQSFSNVSFNVEVPDLSAIQYQSLTIKIWNNALYDNEYCYIDNFYLFASDTWMEFDDCSAFDSSWTINGASITTSNCHSGSCINLTSSTDWAKKTYSDISKYNNLVLIADFKNEGYDYSPSTHWPTYCTTYYSYDNGQESQLGYVYGRHWESKPNQVFSIPNARTCGAHTLAIRFESDSDNNGGCTIDNVALLGNILDTPFPTRFPTRFPTKNPTSPTDIPTRYPTQSPTTPTVDPSLDPSIAPSPQPTKQPTNAPSTIPTVVPTKHPTLNPTNVPTMVPTNIPTLTPTNIPTLLPTEHPTMTPTNIPTLLPTDHPTVTPTEHPTLTPTNIPTVVPTEHLTKHPTKLSTALPSTLPTDTTIQPTIYPTVHPTTIPAKHSTKHSTEIPTKFSTYYPSKSPTKEAVTQTSSSASHPTDGPTLTPSSHLTFFPSAELISNASAAPTMYPLNYPISVTISSTNVAANSSDAMNVESIILIVVSILVFLLILVIVYVLYQNKTRINNVYQEDHGDAQIGSANIKRTEVEMQSSTNNTLGNETTDDDIRDTHNILERNKKIRAWFENHVKLKESNEKYYSLFMLNGYDQLSLIAEITNNELIEMGINKMAHRNRILKAVEIIDTDYILH